jgi:hypothetical protein
VRLTPSRAALVLCGVVAAVLALAVLGRHERASASSHEENGIRTTAALTRGRAPTAYRLTVFADCLLYPVSADPWALELCFDPHGRVVEAIDRQTRSHTRIWSVRYDPALSPVRESPRRLFDTFQAIGAYPASTRFTGFLPLSQSLPTTGTAGDTGPVLIRSPG